MGRSSHMAETTMPPLVPYLVVQDCKTSAEWFGTLGFCLDVEMPGPDGPIVPAVVSRGPGCRIMFGRDPTRQPGIGGAGVNLYLTIADSVDALHDHAIAAGILSTAGLEDQFWGDRIFNIHHPDGY